MTMSLVFLKAETLFDIEGSIFLKVFLRIKQCYGVQIKFLGINHASFYPCKYLKIKYLYLLHNFFSRAYNSSKKKTFVSSYDHPIINWPCRYFIKILVSSQQEQCFRFPEIPVSRFCLYLLTF